MNSIKQENLKISSKKKPSYEQPFKNLFNKHRFFDCFDFIWFMKKMRKGRRKQKKEEKNYEQKCMREERRKKEKGFDDEKGKLLKIGNIQFTVNVN